MDFCLSNENLAQKNSNKQSRSAVSLRAKETSKTTTTAEVSPIKHDDYHHEIDITAKTHQCHYHRRQSPPHHCYHTTLTHQHGDTNTQTAPEPDPLQSVQPKCYRCWVRLRTMYYIYSMYVWRLLWLFVKLRDMKERLVGPL